MCCALILPLSEGIGLVYPLHPFHYAPNLPADYPEPQSSPSRPSSSHDFHLLLRLFLNSDGARYRHSVVLSNAAPHTILSSRVDVLTHNLPDSPTQVRDGCEPWCTT